MISGERDSNLIATFFHSKFNHLSSRCHPRPFHFEIKLIDFNLSKSEGTESFEARSGGENLQTEMVHLE